MQRIRVERKPTRRRRTRPTILALDARDPDVVRAKALWTSAHSRDPRRAA
jgi:hypothetical protein